MTTIKYYYMEWVYYILEGMKEKKKEDWRLDKMDSDDLSNNISGTQWKKNRILFAVVSTQHEEEKWI